MAHVRTSELPAAAAYVGDEDLVAVQDDETVRLPAATFQKASTLSPIIITRTAGSLAVGVAANTWHDVDLSGTAAARDLDVVIPGVEAGDWIVIEPSMFSANTAAGVYLDMHTIVDGVPVHRFAGDQSPTSAGGVSAWLCFANYVGIIGAPAWYQVQADDIDDGAVRCRLRDHNTTTTARTLSATATIPLRLAGRGPFG